MKEQTPTDESEDRGACAPVELVASGGKGPLERVFRGLGFARNPFGAGKV
jgi:hypothetical protein